MGRLEAPIIIFNKKQSLSFKLGARAPPLRPLHRRPCICLDLFCLDLFLPVLRAPTKFNFQKYSALRDPSLCFGLDRGIKPAEHGKMIRFYMVRRFSRITSLSSAVMTMRVDFFEVG